MRYNENGVCLETWNRINILIAAWAYENSRPEVMDDATFDKLALEIDLEETTTRPDLDLWFKENFSPYTGGWVSAFPEQVKLESAYWHKLYRQSGSNDWDAFTKKWKLETKR